MRNDDEMAWVGWVAKVLARPLAEAIEALDGLPVPACEEAVLRQRIARSRVLSVMRSIEDAERLIRGLRQTLAVSPQLECEVKSHPQPKRPKKPKHHVH